MELKQAVIFVNNVITTTTTAGGDEEVVHEEGEQQQERQQQRGQALTYELLPDPMVTVHDKPFLHHLLDLLKTNGITEVILLLSCCGMLAEKIQSYFGCYSDDAIRIQIKYSITPVEYGTGSRLRKAGKLLAEYFLLMYCDKYWQQLNLQELVRTYVQYNKLALMTVYTNRHGITKNDVEVNANGFVVNYDKRREAEGLNCVDMGFFILNRKVLDWIPPDVVNFSFEREILPKLIEARELVAYRTELPYFSISTPAQLKATEEFFKPKKIIFLDRDGVINKKPPEQVRYVLNWELFEFSPGAIEAIRLLNQYGYKVIVITNQPAISKGLMTEAELHRIHDNLQKELHKHGAHIDAFYYCPHDPDEGCFCRKPKPGLLIQAAIDYKLNLEKTIFIGDDTRDIEAGNAVGCKTIRVTQENQLIDIVKTQIVTQLCRNC